VTAPVDPDTLDAPALRDLCRQLDAEAQDLWEALDMVLKRLVSAGYVRARPRQPVLAAKPGRVDPTKAPLVE
jgi:hypothetical protein